MRLGPLAIACCWLAGVSGITTGFLPVGLDSPARSLDPVAVESAIAPLPAAAIIEAPASPHAAAKAGIVIPIPLLSPWRPVVKRPVPGHVRFVDG